MPLPIEVEALRYTVGSREVLRGVDLRVGAGEIVTVMGLSGSGKTTLLKCMAGLLRPDSGAIRLGDLDLVRIPEPALNEQRRRMGMVFQYAALFDSMTVAENVGFALQFHRVGTAASRHAVVQEQLASVGLGDIGHLLPAQLSGGMRKRVGLARALAAGPEVVFYDEPTSGLDPVVARVIDQLIVRVRDRLGVTSVIVSHDVPSVLLISDRVAFLHNGRILEYAPAPQFRESEVAEVRQFLEGRSDGPIHVEGT